MTRCINKLLAPVSTVWTSIKVKKPDDGDYVLGRKWAPKFGERLLALFTAKVTQKTKFPMLFHKKDFPRKEDGTLNVKSWKDVVYEPSEEQIPDHAC